MDHCATDTARPAATVTAIPANAHKATFPDSQGWDLHAQDDGGIFLLHQIPTDDNPERRHHLIALTDAQAANLIAFLSARLALTGKPQTAAQARPTFSFGIPLENADETTSSAWAAAPILVDTADVYSDRVTLFRGDAPAVSLTKACAQGLAREILKVHGAGEVA